MGNRRFFQFENLSRAVKLSQRFISEYQQLPRNSGKCHELWLEVIKFEGIVLHLRGQVGDLFDFSLPGFLPQDFVQRRSVEEKQHLKKIERAIRDAVGYLINFSVPRNKHLQDFGENWKVARQDRRTNKNYDALLQNLQESVQNWYQYVQDDGSPESDTDGEAPEAVDTTEMMEPVKLGVTYPKAAKRGSTKRSTQVAVVETKIRSQTLSTIIRQKTQHPLKKMNSIAMSRVGDSGLSETVEQHIEKMLREKPIFDCTVSLINDLKERMKFAEDNVHLKRIESILPAIEDINAELNHAELTLIINAAKERVAKLRTQKPKGLKRLRFSRNRTTQTSYLPIAEATAAGLQSLGPLYILPVSDEWRKRFDFDRTAGTLVYSCDLSDCVVNENNTVQKDVIVQGASSPTSEITLRDKETLLRLNIPAEARHFGYVYPIDYETISSYRFKLIDNGYSAEIQREEIEAVNTLLAYGGFVYYDEDYRMIQLNGLKKGGVDLYFSGPHVLHDKEIEIKIEELREAGRLCKVDAPELYKLGAREYAWLRPGELRKQDHGGFIFLYGDENWAPSYFEVVNQRVGRDLAIQDNTAKLEAVLKSYNPEQY